MYKTIPLMYVNKEIQVSEVMLVILVCMVLELMEVSSTAQFQTFVVRQFDVTRKGWG